MTHPNNAIAFNTKEKWVIKQWKNLEEPGMHITKWKKSTEKKGPLLIPIIWHHTIWHFGNGDSKKMMTAGGHKEMHRQSTEELSTVNPFCMLPSGYTSSNICQTNRTYIRSEPYVHNGCDVIMQFLGQQQMYHYNRVWWQLGQLYCSGDQKRMVTLPLFNFLVSAKVLF